MHDAALQCCNTTDNKGLTACCACLPARYGTVQGYSSFRRCLAAFLSDATQHKVDPEELLITAGALALDLLLVLQPSNSAETISTCWRHVLMVSAAR
jgi:aspartate/methionine/tyrosine aminotransferase